VFVAAMIRRLMTRRGIVYRVCSRCTVSRGDALGASQMLWRLAGYPGSETKTAPAVIAPFLRHRAQRVALGMIAGSAAWTARHSGGWNCHDAHRFILAVFSAATGTPPSG
jgi:hypothetical protein